MKLLYLHMAIIQVLPRPLLLRRPCLRLRSVLQVSVPGDSRLHLRPGRHGGVTGGELQGANAEEGYFDASTGEKHLGQHSGNRWQWCDTCHSAPCRRYTACANLIPTVRNDCFGRHQDYGCTFEIVLLAVVACFLCMVRSR